MSRRSKSTSSPRAGTATTKSWESVKGGLVADSLVSSFVESVSFDRRLYKHDIAGSLAHARMLADCDLISKKDLGQITKGLGQIGKQIDRLGDAWPGWKTELEDVHMCLEAALIEMIGDAGRRLHTGRSRNDQVALDLKLWIRDAVTDLRHMIDDLSRSFVTLAVHHGQIVMPAYTHLQRAQPIMVGAELLAWVEALDRGATRLEQLLSLGLENPLGSGAIAGSSLHLNRHHTTKSLGLKRPTANSIDATATRDVALDFVYGLAMIATTLSRWAEQWILYASTEFDFIRLSEIYTTGSSMMPQKRNPDMLELIRGRCGDLYGRLVALLTMCKGLPLGYNRDLQEDKRHIFDAYDGVAECLVMASKIVRTTQYDKSRIANALDKGFLDATSLADYLVTKGVPFRTAHQVVGQLVRQCEQMGYEQLSQLKMADFNQACHAVKLGTKRCSNDVYKWLGAENVVKRYCTTGNAGASGVRRQLQSWRKRLKM